MKNICITKSNDKLNINLPYYTDLINLYEIDVAINSIYKSSYTFKDKVDTFIFNLSKLNSELISFVSEFADIYRFIVYIDTEDTDLVQQINSKCKYLVKDTIKVNIDNAHKLPEFIINDKIYSSLDLQSDKKNQLVYFLDNDTTIPNNLNQILYPNTKLPIKMFNGPNISHPQCLGHLNELHRKNILLESAIYLYTNNLFNIEAYLCGCKLIDLNNIGTNIQDFEDVIQYADENAVQQYGTYSKFIEEFLL